MTDGMTVSKTDGRKNR